MELADYKPDTWVMFHAHPLPQVVPGLDDDGYDLLSRLLIYDPAKRINCKEAMAHHYFHDLPKDNLTKV